MKNGLNIKLCVAGNALGINSILKQEGIIFFEAGYFTGPIDSKIAIILLSREITHSEIDKVKRFISDGGVVIFDKINQRFSAYLKPSQRVNPDFSVGIFTKPYEVFKMGCGCFIYINIDLNQSFMNSSSIVKEFITGAGVVKERVASLSKSGVRKILSAALRTASNFRGVPFIKTWYYPGNYRGAFNFRFDVDEDTADDLKQAMLVSNEYKNCCGWYVSCASFEKSGFKTGDLINERFDVQTHGYFHHTYRSKKQNALNIDNSISYLNRLNCYPKGYVSPKGSWNEGLQELLEERGFLYSSEFSLDYDNFPFYPFIKNRLSKVLQIPIHPVCLGLFTDAQITDDKAILDYFKKVILAKYNSNLPVFLYGHPNERLINKLDIWKNIYKYSVSLPDVWKVTFSEFAKWWNKRYLFEFEELSFEPHKQRLNYKVKPNSDYSEVSFCISKDTANKTAYFQLSGGTGVINLNELNYESAKEPENKIYDERTFKLSWRKRLKALAKEFIDWEECTPLEQLYKDSFRSWVKYQLRKYKTKTVN